MRLIDKKVIDLDALYAQKQLEIQQADPEGQAELKRRVEEDKKIQEAQLKSEGEAKPGDAEKTKDKDDLKDGKNKDVTDGSSDKKGAKA
jgi:energy-coupling factor transport system substrate-specific component